MDVAHTVRKAGGQECAQLPDPLLQGSTRRGSPPIAHRSSLFARRLQEVHALTHRGVRLRPSKPAAEATPHAAEADELVHSRTPQHFVAFILSP